MGCWPLFCAYRLRPKHFTSIFQSKYMGTTTMIVIVEDREAIAKAYANSFDREGVAASSVISGDFNEWVRTTPDEDLDCISGFLIGDCRAHEEVARLIRSRSAAAVIALKDQRSLDHTLQLLSEGFDDVVTKPCHAREILARIAAIGRRMQASKLESADASDIRVFGDGRDPIVGGAPLPLPRRELRILEYLAARGGRRATKAQIFNAVYGMFDHSIDETVVESHISKLRRRLREALGRDVIESKRHLGYRLTATTSSAKQMN
jgi:DNA-binding response OmpR family regulator